MPNPQFAVLQYAASRSNKRNLEIFGTFRENDADRTNLGEFIILPEKKLGTGRRGIDYMM